MDLDKVNQWTHAGVIVLYERSTECLILNKRSEHLRTHPGEVCFPGGIWEEGDKDLYATALRELDEELGISSERITLIRELAVERTLLGSIIHPWFASIDFLEPFQINNNEVASVLHIPMTLVMNLKNYKDIWVERRGIKFKSCQFIGHEEYIWGATARIMRRLTLTMPSEA